MISSLMLAGVAFVSACTLCMLMMARMLYHAVQKPGQVSGEHLVHTPTPQPEQDLDESYDSYGLGQSERDHMFDMRIAKMKDELANEHVTAPRIGYPAEESPGVSNLPHSLIPDLHTNMIEEEYVK